MKRFAMSQAGRLPVELDGDLKQCLAQVRAIARSELKRARTHSKQATLHRPTAWAWVITMGKDHRSSLWTLVSLIRN